MAEATQEMIALAREMFAEHKGWGNNAPFWDDLRKGLDNGVFDREPELRIAIAAIQATTERAAKFASWAHMVPPDGGSPTEEECDLAASIAEGLRAAAHLKEQSA